MRPDFARFLDFRGCLAPASARGLPSSPMRPIKATVIRLAHLGLHLSGTKRNRLRPPESTWPQRWRGARMVWMKSLLLKARLGVRLRRTSGTRMISIEQSKDRIFDMPRGSNDFLQVRSDVVEGQKRKRRSGWCPNCPSKSKISASSTTIRLQATSTTSVADRCDVKAQFRTPP